MADIVEGVSRRAWVGQAKPAKARVLYDAMNGDGRAAMVHRNAVALATGDSYGLDGEDLQLRQRSIDPSE